MRPPLVVIGGARGFVGRELARQLQAEGVDLRCGSRHAAAARRHRPHHTWVRLDVDRPDTLRWALDGAHTYVHLVHHLEEDCPDLVAHEVAAAERVVKACARTGVKRIVYLGAPPPGPDGSVHLRARFETGQVFHRSPIPSFELRASMIVGPGSASWQMVRDLALRLPALALPPWASTRTQPVWIGDVVAALRACIFLPETDAGVWNLPGPDVLTGEEILLTVAKQAALRPAKVRLRALPTSLSAVAVGLVTGTDPRVAKRLLHGLGADNLFHDRDLFAHLGGRSPRRFADAVAEVLADPRDKAEGLAGGWERTHRWLHAQLPEMA